MSFLWSSSRQQSKKIVRSKSVGSAGASMRGVLPTQPMEEVAVRMEEGKKQQEENEKVRQSVIKKRKTRGSSQKMARPDNSSMLSLNIRGDRLTGIGSNRKTQGQDSVEGGSSLTRGFLSKLTRKANKSLKKKRSQTSIYEYEPDKDFEFSLGPSRNFREKETSEVLRTFPTVSSFTTPSKQERKPHSKITRGRPPQISQNGNRKTSASEAEQRKQQVVLPVPRATDSTKSLPTLVPKQVRTLKETEREVRTTTVSLYGVDDREVVEEVKPVARPPQRERKNPKITNGATIGRRGPRPEDFDIDV